MALFGERPRRVRTAPSDRGCQSLSRALGAPGTRSRSARRLGKKRLLADPDRTVPTRSGPARRLTFHELWGNFGELDSGGRPDGDVHNFPIDNALRQIFPTIGRDRGPGIRFVRGTRGGPSIPGSAFGRVACGGAGVGTGASLRSAASHPGPTCTAPPGATGCPQPVRLRTRRRVTG